MAVSKVMDGLSDAAAYARIQTLIDLERQKIARNWEKHPGSAARTTSEYLRGLQAAQNLFCQSHVVQVRK
jgi:hypothetical protein